MQVRTVSFEAGIEQVRQVRPYESDRITARLGIVVELGDGENEDAALQFASSFVLTNLNTMLPITEANGATQSAAAPLTAAPQQGDAGQDPAWAALAREQPAPQQARPAATPERPAALTEKQLKAIYAIARATQRLSEQQVDARCFEMFNCRPEELSKAEASQFIDSLKAAS